MSLVTAPSDATVKKYAVTLSSKVDENNLVVNKKSHDYYYEILKNYDSLVSNFRSMGNEFKKAKKNVVGAGLKNKLVTAGNKCINQSEACKNRKQDLQNAYSGDLYMKLNIFADDFGIDNI